MKRAVICIGIEDYEPLRTEDLYWYPMDISAKEFKVELKDIYEFYKDVAIILPITHKYLLKDFKKGAIIQYVYPCEATMQCEMDCPMYEKGCMKYGNKKN